jgi:hypothetical protein
VDHLGPIRADVLLWRWGVILTSHLHGNTDKARVYHVVRVHHDDGKRNFEINHMKSSREHLQSRRTGVLDKLAALNTNMELVKDCQDPSFFGKTAGGSSSSSSSRDEQGWTLQIM